LRHRLEDLPEHGIVDLGVRIGPEGIVLRPLQAARREPVAPELHLLRERRAPVDRRRAAHPKLTGGSGRKTT
jgi:hypothetical protein